ncbi:hypothetical protein [Noviherbaspirillum aridicola]|uniref:hypothetical protein n=1 Tax=Noviherbaspirillum aridicola TaxID=2849687 RepID=UPI001C818BFA|nr:hypothetical protein [Noviherbaspirillum aridicola]
MYRRHGAQSQRGTRSPAQAELPESALHVRATRQGTHATVSFRDGQSGRKLYWSLNGDSPAIPAISAAASRHTALQAELSAALASARRGGQPPAPGERERPRWLEKLPAGATLERERFCVRHKLVSHAEFTRLMKTRDVRDELVCEGDYEVPDMVRLTEKGATFNINDCTAVILTNGEKGSLGHFIPQGDNLSSDAIRIAIEEDVRALSADGRPVSALIVGGEADNQDSRTIYERVRAATLSAGARAVSEVWGRKEPIDTDSNDSNADCESAPRIRSFFDAARRTNYLAVDAYDDINSLKGVSYWYENFHIASPDVWEAQGRIYTADEANAAAAAYKSRFEPGRIVPEVELNQASSRNSTTGD